MITLANPQQQVEVFYFARPPEPDKAMATGYFFRVQVRNGRNTAYMDVDAKGEKVRSKICLAGGAVAEHICRLQGQKSGGIVTITPLNPSECARLSVEAFDELVAENPTIRENPNCLL